MEHRKDYSKGYNYKNNKNPIIIEVVFYPNGVRNALEDIKYGDYDVAKDLFEEVLDNVSDGFDNMLKNLPVIPDNKFDLIVEVFYPNARRFVRGMEVWEKERDTMDDDVKYIYETTMRVIKKHL